MQSSYINSAVLHKIEGLNYPPLPMLHTLNALLEIKLRNCRVSIETKAIIKWLEMAFKLPSNVMTGTKHPINSVCSSKPPTFSNVSRWASKRNSWSAFCDWNFYLYLWTEWEMTQALFHTGRFDWHFNHRSNIKEVIYIWIFIFTKSGSVFLAHLNT